MTYDEAYEENPTITRSEALLELKKHGAILAEFFDEVGDQPTYEARAVLQWLGY